MTLPITKPTLTNFLKSGRRNQWLYSTEMKIFVRRASHVIEDLLTRTLDVANISVETEFQKQGYFTDWLTYAESEAKLLGLEAIYVESIQNENLAAFLLKRGYKKVMPKFDLGEGLASNMYLLIDK